MGYWPRSIVRNQFSALGRALSVLKSMLFPPPPRLIRRSGLSYSLLLQNKFGQLCSPEPSTCVRCSNRCAAEGFWKWTEWTFWPEHAVYRRIKSFTSSCQVETKNLQESGRKEHLGILVESLAWWAWPWGQLWGSGRHCPCFCLSSGSDAPFLLRPPTSPLWGPALNTGPSLFYFTCSACGGIPCRRKPLEGEEDCFLWSLCRFLGLAFHKYQRIIYFPFYVLRKTPTTFVFTSLSQKDLLRDFCESSPKNPSEFHFHWNRSGCTVSNCGKGLARTCVHWHIHTQ